MKQAFASEFGEHINLKFKIASPEPTEVQQNQIKGNKSRIQNIIAIASGKGGVGKSTLPLIWQLLCRKWDFRWSVLDADIYDHSVPTMFDTESENQFLWK